MQVISPLLLSDAYKQSHIHQYPKGTELVYSNWTPRSDKHAKTKRGVVVFGIQAFLSNLDSLFRHTFFSLPKDVAVESFARGYRNFFGVDEVDTSHVEALHDLGYLPIKIKALPEGTVCPIGVPILTIRNTRPEFYWLTNSLETIMSSELWLPMTSATIALEYRIIVEKWAEKTCDSRDHIPFQCHDFSMRGMAGIDAAMASGAASLLSFWGTDTIPAYTYLEEHYGADPSKELIGTSIPATEHSVMSMGTVEGELGTFKRLITEIYPSGMLAIVSDTWNLWTVLSDYVPKLKQEILSRDGKIVLRPDSGNPADIICGDPSAPDNSPARKGVISLLWDTFGGEINSKGYKVLDSHIGAIYGDSITLEIAEEICRRLEIDGYASSNIVFGVGSYTYQFNTRDTYGFAMKATYGVVNGEGREIYKDPITDNGSKKSLKGLIKVQYEGNSLVALDQVTPEEELEGELVPVFEDGDFLATYSLSDIREKINRYVNG